jgi:hypothetical protein
MHTVIAFWWIFMSCHPASKNLVNDIIFFQAGMNCDENDSA